jgi:hypothetical protein
MGKELFDASIGLAFSLAAFEKYQKSGLLQAELHHVPGIDGRCKGCLHIAKGKVVSCSIEDKSGQSHPMQLHALIRLDNERGPFNWTLTDAPTLIEQAVVPPQHVPKAPTPTLPIPKIVALLNLDQLHGWVPGHKQILFQVYRAINGQRNITEIKQVLPLPPYITEEALHVLSTLNIITFT